MTTNQQDAITVGAAYAAMYEFLKRFNKTFKSGDVATLLTGLSTLPDGRPMDNAYAEEWIECVEKARNGDVHTEMKLEK